MFKYSKEIKQKAIELYKSGLSQEITSKIVKVDRTTVGNWTRTLKITRNLSESHKGQHSSPATEFKKGICSFPDAGFKKGNIPWNKNKKTGLIPKTAFKKGYSAPNTAFKKGQKPWNYSNLFKKCAECKKDFHIFPAILHLRKYCSNKCKYKSFSRRMSGKNHPLYKDGRKYYRKLALNKFPFKCSVCGSIKKLHVHHKDKNRLNNNINNLQVVCVKCHKSIIHPRKNGRFAN